MQDDKHTSHNQPKWISVPRMFAHHLESTNSSYNWNKNYATWRLWMCRVNRIKRAWHAFSSAVFSLRFFGSASTVVSQGPTAGDCGVPGVVGVPEAEGGAAGVLVFASAPDGEEFSEGEAAGAEEGLGLANCSCVSGRLRFSMAVICWFCLLTALVGTGVTGSSCFSCLTSTLEGTAMDLAAVALFGSVFSGAVAASVLTADVGSAFGSGGFAGAATKAEAVSGGGFACAGSTGGAGGSAGVSAGLAAVSASGSAGGSAAGSAGASGAVAVPCPGTVDTVSFFARHPELFLPFKVFRTFLGFLWWLFSFSFDTRWRESYLLSLAGGVCRPMPCVFPSSTSKEPAGTVEPGLPADPAQ